MSDLTCRLLSFLVYSDTPPLKCLTGVALLHEHSVNVDCTRSVNVTERAYQHPKLVVVTTLFNSGVG